MTACRLRLQTVKVARLRMAVEDQAVEDLAVAGREAADLREFRAYP
jgi:hypothetical protein